MTIPELIAWHKKNLDRLERRSLASGDIDAEAETQRQCDVHWDAIQLLGWCVELPSAVTGDGARAYTFDVVMDFASNAYGQCVKAVKEDKEDSDIDKRMQRIFDGLIRSCDEQMNDPRVKVVFTGRSEGLGRRHTDQRQPSPE